jgi:carboxyl-terminal processing protease
VNTRTTLRSVRDRLQRHATKSARALALLTTGFLAGAIVARPAPNAYALTEAENPYSMLRQLGRVLVQIEANYVDPVERSQLLQGAVRGMVSGLDPHSGYMDKAEYTAFQSDTAGKFGGIGIEIDLRGDVVTVIAPIEGSPAERAGIRSGDRILGVERELVQEKGVDSVLKLLRGKPGTKVRIVLRRASQPEPIAVEIVREEISVKPVIARRLEGNVLYVRIKQFTTGTHREFLHEIGKLKGPFAGVLVDLRANPGGLVDEAVDVADEFMDRGNILSMRSRGKTVESHDASIGGILVGIPAVVLVNEWSASASEFLAGALQDSRVAKVVGLTSFGKGSVQTIYDLPGGDGLKLTTARYYTPSGRAVQGKGIEPDVKIVPKPELLPAIREADLDGALAGEGTNRAQAQKTVFIDAGAAELAPTREIPVQPLFGKDEVLRVAYTTLQTEIKK